MSPGSVAELRKLPLQYAWMTTPIGRLLLAGDDAGLHFLGFPGGSRALLPQPAWSPAETPFVDVKRQLDAYFAGDLRAFDLPLVVHGTDFQCRVWTVLRTIPYGQTRSYGWLAAELGAPRASRAVGAANGANPLPIIVPCHRVIGASGSLTGFGGGLPTKRYLLGLEAAGSGEQLSLLS